MNSLKRGFAFLKQSWQMAAADGDLVKPSIYALLAGLVVSLLAIIPMAVVGLIFGDSGIGQALLFILGTLLVFAQFTVGYIFSAMTIYLIYGYLSEGDGKMDKAWAIVRRDFWDIISLAAASTAVNVLKRLIEGKGNNRGRNFLAGLLNTVWTEATFLVLPAMVIEDINLKSGLQRATGIVRNHLLLVGVSTVGVRLVNGIIGFLLGGTGIALGLGVGIGLVSLSGGAPVGWISGISLGVLVAALFIMVATVISSYTATAYHTCLYLWARDVERSAGTADYIAPPAPLAAVLGDLDEQISAYRTASS
jgi:MFS family permease